MTFTELIRKNLKFVLILPVAIAGLVLIASLFQKPMYKSSVSLMVVQIQSQEVQAQEAVQSAEQMADILSRVVDSVAFRNAVLAASDVNVDLPVQPWEQSKEWRKIVKTKNITDTGILVVDVYQPTMSGATKLAGVVELTIIEQGYGFLGARTEDVFLRQLNPPTPTDNKPASPNLLLNVAVGWLFGLIAALSFLLLFPNFKWFSKRKTPQPATKPEAAPQTARTPQITEPAALASASDEEDEARSPVVKPQASAIGGLIYSNNLLDQIKHPMASASPSPLETVSSYSPPQEEGLGEVATEADSYAKEPDVEAAAVVGSRAPETEMNLVSRANASLKREF